MCVHECLKGGIEDASSVRGVNPTSWSGKRRIPRSGATMGA